MVKAGVTRMLESRLLRGLRVGAILNPTSVDPARICFFTRAACG